MKFPNIVENARPYLRSPFRAGAFTHGIVFAESRRSDVAAIFRAGSLQQRASVGDDDECDCLVSDVST